MDGAKECIAESLGFIGPMKICAQQMASVVQLSSPVLNTSEARIKIPSVKNHKEVLGAWGLIFRAAETL